MCRWAAFVGTRSTTNLAQQYADLDDRERLDDEHMLGGMTALRVRHRVASTRKGPSRFSRADVHRKLECQARRLGERMNKGLMLLLILSVLLAMFGLYIFHWQGVNFCNGKGGRFLRSHSQ